MSYPFPGSDSTNDMKTKKFALHTGAFFACVIGGLMNISLGVPAPVDESAPESTRSPKQKIFNFDVDRFHFETYNLNYNETLGDILLYQGISWDSILKLDRVSSDVFSIRRFRARKPFTLVKEDPCEAPICVVYEPDKFTFVRYHLQDGVRVEKHERSYETCQEVVSGRIESSLWLAMKEAGLGSEIIDKMEDALSSSVYFHHAQKGDEFRLVYEKKYIDDKPVGYGRLLGASYKNASGEHYGILYENDHYTGFYDITGRPTIRTFLKAPVKYSRISSRFSYSRFHPIKRKRIPHLGTDYAAPIGTPIYAVADGIVEIAGYTRNNGKYVKIKHDDIYKTQYLHMNRFAKGIKSGVRVTQGQVIGEVGKTGLATGPHVCFRFWKYGRQVNHLKENFPPKEPLPEAMMPEYYNQRDGILSILESIPYVSEFEDTAAL